MQDAIMNIMNSWGVIGVFLLIAAENIFPPIPSEIILIFGGALTAPAFGGKIGIIEMIIASTLGAMIGALALYYVGKILKADRLKKIISGKLGRLLRVKAQDIDKADNWFRTRGSITVLLCRCVPILRSLISIPAGMSQMKMPCFLLYTMIGTAIWNTILVSIGHNLGERWQTILILFDRFEYLILAICIICFVAALIWWFGFRKRKNQSNDQAANSSKTDSQVATNDKKYSR